MQWLPVDRRGRPVPLTVGPFLAESVAVEVPVPTDAVEQGDALAVRITPGTQAILLAVLVEVVSTVPGVTWLAVEETIGHAALATLTGEDEAAAFAAVAGTRWLGGVSAAPAIVYDGIELVLRPQDAMLAPVNPSAATGLVRLTGVFAALH